MSIKASVVCKITKNAFEKYVYSIGVSAFGWTLEQFLASAIRIEFV
jgi:hypothetical protein